MKNKGAKNVFLGYLIFFCTFAVNSSLAVVFYSTIKDLDNLIIAVLILLFIIFTSLICTIIDMIRRKIMIEKPSKEILEATTKMANGDFNVNLLILNKSINYTEYDEIKEHLNILAHELRENEVLKNDFISNVSHEIKTPLAIIQNYAKALEDKNLEEEVRDKYLSSIINGCKNLTSLVTNILKLNKLENQNLKLEVESFNISESIINEILKYEKIFEDKSIELNCDIEEDLFINSSEECLNIIWSNLISNAIKFTNDQIVIKLQKKNEYLIFEIKDNGIGMSNETGKHIFDKFYQGDTSHFKEGNGLGLALIKKVIDILGGEIFVSSEENVGTTFIVKLKGVSYGREI